MSGAQTLKPIYMISSVSICDVKKDVGRESILRREEIYGHEPKSKNMLIKYGPFSVLKKSNSKTHYFLVVKSSVDVAGMAQ